MPVQMTLNIVTQVMCIITLALAITALLPQIKVGMVFLRDLVLWALLFGFLAVVGFFGWIRLHEIRIGERQVASPVLEIPRLPDEEVFSETRTSDISQVEPLSTTPYIPPLDITNIPKQRSSNSQPNQSPPANSFRANRSASTPWPRSHSRKVSFPAGFQRLQPITYDKRYVDRRITSR